MKKILISACLLGENVRYDAANNNLLSHPVLKDWFEAGRFVGICPEVAGGLPTPRAPAEIQSQFPILITTDKGEDVTPEFLLGAELALEKAQQQQVCCALMKAKSPSCGNNQVYDGSFSGELIPGSGTAAAELIQSGLPVFNENQLEELIQFIDQQEHPEPAPLHA